MSTLATLRTTTAAAARLRNQLIAKLHALSQGSHDEQRAGMVHALVVNDSERVEEMLAEVADPLLPALPLGGDWTASDGGARPAPSSAL